MTGLVKQDDIKKKQEETKETWWKRLKIRKRSITLFTTLSITIGISVIIALVYVVHYRKPEVTVIEDIQLQYEIYENHLEAGDKQENICTSDECIHTASRVLKYINKNIDPCNNFYDFACGNFVKDINVQEYSFKTDSIDNLETLVQHQLISMIAEPIQTNESRPFQLIKKLYMACMNEKQIESEGLDTIKRILHHLGGWPVLDEDSWAEEDFNWNDFDHQLAKLGYGSSYFLNLVIEGDPEISTKTISVGKPELLMEQSTLNELYKYMVSLAVLIGADRERAEVELKESIEFEFKLRDNYTKSDENYTSMDIVQLIANFPSIPWKEYMADLPVNHTQLVNDELVFHVYQDYMIKFEHVIDQTPKRVQANYLMWRVVADSLQYLAEDFDREELAYLSQSEQEEGRWMECLGQTIWSFPVAFEAMYVSKYFNKYAKLITEEMVTDIRTEFYEMLKKVDWMDEKTRKYALEKANAMVANIGYPEELMDTAKLEEYYSRLELNTDNYLISILEINIFTKRHFYQHSKRTFDEAYREWKIKSYSSSVYYSYDENSIELPAGSLQDSFFNFQRPKYMNYGAIGYIIATKMIMGINEFGSMYDKNGNLMDCWWQNQTITAFYEKVQYFLDLHGQSVRPEIDIHEPFLDTLILQDNGGIRIAYLAYRDWLERNTVEPKLPGLDFTPQQMFWISAANMWCVNYNIINKDLGSSIEQFAVSNFISNSEYFVKDFNCPKSSPTNATKSCQIW